jgi:hypothetical protein
MKKAHVIGLVTGLLLAVVSLAAQTGQSYKGEIMDSACAAAGSHAAMEKDHPDLNAKSCTVGCVKMGAKYVLYDADTKTVYKLSDQKRPEQFAGDKVEVTGTLDKATKTIHVTDIKAAS